MGTKYVYLDFGSSPRVRLFRKCYALIKFRFSGCGRFLRILAGRRSFYWCEAMADWVKLHLAILASANKDSENGDERSATATASGGPRFGDRNDGRYVSQVWPTAILYGLSKLAFLFVGCRTLVNASASRPIIEKAN